MGDSPAFGYMDQLPHLRERYGTSVYVVDAMMVEVHAVMRGELKVLPVNASRTPFNLGQLRRQLDAIQARDEA